MPEYLEWLERSSWAASIRKSLWMYPALEIVHILGIVMLVGSAFLFDIRLLGFSKHLQVAALEQHLLLWSRKGLILVIPSGALLFITNAKTLGMDPTFWIKMILLLLAGLNAFLYHKFPSSEHSESFQRVGIHALLSIIFWIGVISCGRLLAY